MEEAKRRERLFFAAMILFLCTVTLSISWGDYIRRNKYAPEGRESKEALGPAAAEEIDAGREVARFALQFTGTPYIWGGESLTQGADCSGFVKSVYEHFQISLPHSAEEDREQGYPVDGLENARPGDLICYEDPSHVAIYVGDGKVVHASPENGICIAEAGLGRISAIRRIIPE